MRESFNELSYKELLTKKDELSKKYSDHRFNVVVGHVENTVDQRILRRKIARVNTLIHEFDIGIRKQ
ncbi:MAG: 50S ribosomal protein L29 [Spirochaetaceae bacterium]|nr:MAG: 50S ribosomal protein L29 [Spirochaetaceae bacterium]